MPDRKDVEEEMVALLRSMGDRNHRKPASVMTFLAADTYPSPNKKNLVVWPPFKDTSGADARNLGKCLSLSSREKKNYVHGQSNIWGCFRH